MKKNYIFQSLLFAVVFVTSETLLASMNECNPAVHFCIKNNNSGNGENIIVQALLTPLNIEDQYDDKREIKNKGRSKLKEIAPGKNLLYSIGLNEKILVWSKSTRTVICPINKRQNMLHIKEERFQKPAGVQKKDFVRGKRLYDIVHEMPINASCIEITTNVQTCDEYLGINLQKTVEKK